MGTTSTKKEQQRLFKGENDNFQRSTFNLGYKNKLTAPFNKLVPTCVKHIMPGDSVHTKTDFFTRWLSLQAPVFADYEMKFSNWFIKYTQLWGGFDKFMGEGDAQSADYLLDGSSQGKYASQVPYFTSRALSRIAFNRLYNYSIPSVWKVMIDNFPLHVNSSFRDKFKMVLVPVCAFRTTGEKAWNKTYSTAPSDWVVGYYQGNDVTESIKNRVILTPMLWKNDNFTRNCIDNQLIFDLDSVPESASTYDISDFITFWSGSNLLNDIDSRVPKWAFTYAGTNLPIFRDEDGEIMDFAVYEMGHDCLPIDSELFGCIPTTTSTSADSGDTIMVEGWSNFAGTIDFDNAEVTQYFGCCSNYHFRRLSSEEQSATGYTYSYFYEYGYTYQLYGFMRSLSPTELYDYVAQQWQDCTIGELWDRTFGQLFVKSFLGTGTLADYLGLSYEEMTLRQPFTLASAIQVAKTYNGDSIAHNPYKYKRTPIGEEPESYAKNRWTADLMDASRNCFGNYNRDSAKISVGIVNDVKISCLAFLAYHKAYSDTLRDERYSLRYVYSDPYTSPFLLPLASTNDFIMGDVFPLSYSTSGSIFAITNSGNFEHTGRSAVNVGNVWTKESFVEFFKLQDRRVTQDYFTLMLPTQQMGDPASASVDISADGTFSLDYSGSSNSSLSAAGTSSSKPLGQVFAQVNGADLSYKDGLQGSVSVNELRFAGKLQRFLERSLSAGSSYVKQILAHFGVTPSSSHTQRVMSRYLGGDRFFPTISPVEMLGANDKESGQNTGSQTGQLSCSGVTGEVSFSSDDHGIFIQMLTIQNEFIVCGGVEPSMIDKYDFPLPEFADLPPEAVGISELVNVDGTDNTGYGKVDPNLCFGYVPRYARHKCSKDQIHGQLKTDLSYWVTPRKFNGNWFRGSFGTGDKNNMPELGENFLFEDPNYEAFVDMTDDNHKCIIDMKHYIKVSRQLPVLPTPRLH